MSRFKRPSPALVISILALVAAIVVPAYAALNKKDKKTVKNIANTEITERAPGLAVASANSANTANSADSATTADDANGVQPVGIDFTEPPGTSSLLFEGGGLKVDGTCDQNAGDVILVFESLAANGLITLTRIRGTTVDSQQNDNFDQAETVAASPGGLLVLDTLTVLVSYRSAAGATIDGQFVVSDAFVNTTSCVISGTLFVS